MKTLKYITTALILLSFATQATAQNVAFSTANFSGREAQLEVALQAINKGDTYYSQAQRACPPPFACASSTATDLYNQALKNYLEAQAVNPNNAQLNYKIGVCYAFTSAGNAVPHLEKSLSLDEHTSPDAYYYIGHAYQQQGLFNEAVIYYQKYKAKLPVLNYASYTAQVDKYIAECYHAGALMKEPANVFVDNLGQPLNTASVMTSRPIVSAGGKDIYLNRTYNDNGKMINRIVHLTANGSSYDSTYLNVPLACRRVMNVMQCLSDDKMSMILSAYDKKGKSNLYETYVENGQWQKPKKMSKPVRTCSSSEQTAYLSPNGKVLFFSSNRKGGYGNYDIYMVQRNEKGKWVNAVNLGAGVNTPFEEQVQYLSPDGYTIYFSSRGHNTMGGADIFKSTYNQATNTWSDAENLGYPVNSVNDETSFYPAADNKSFYIASSREGGYGAQDIYKVSSMRAEKNIVSTSEDNLLAYHSTRFTEFLIEPTVIIQQSGGERLITIAGMVVDQKTQKPLRASISLLNNAQAKVIAQFESNGETGRFTVTVPENVNYGLVVTAPGYMFQSDNVDVPSNVRKEFNRFIEMPPLEVDRMVSLRNVFFDFGKATWTPGSKYELDLLYQVLASQPTLKIQIAGHTDNRGKDDLNMKLSNMRAKSVVDYLVNAGISPERLSYIGYGATKPMATNDTVEGRALNRRTEIKIVSK